MTRRWELATPGAMPLGIVADAGNLFVALHTGGVGVLQHSKMVATIPKSKLGGLDATGVLLRGQTLYVTLGDFFAARGAKAGLAVIDVAKPDAPTVRGLWVSERVGRGAVQTVLADDLAYVAAMDIGVHVVDIADPARPRLAATFRPDPDFPRKSPGKLQRPNARGLALAGSKLFVAYDAGGLRVLDIASPTQLVEVGRYVNPAMMRKPQAYNSVAVEGGIAYVAADYAGLETIDVRDPAAIRPLGWWNPWRADAPTNAWFNSGGHTNQLVRVDKRLYLSAGDAELQILDAADPRTPTRIDSYGKPRDGRGAWSVCVAGETVILGYIRAVVPFRGDWSGLVAVERSAT